MALSIEVPDDVRGALPSPRRDVATGLVTIAIGCVVLSACSQTHLTNVSNSWQVNYELAKPKDHPKTVEATRMVRHLIEASRTLHENGAGSIGGTSEELAQLDRYVLSVTPLLSPDFAADLENYRSAVHHTVASHKTPPGFNDRVLVDPLLQVLWDPDAEVISDDADCDRDSGEIGFTVHSLLISAKIYSGLIAQTDIIFRRIGGDLKIVRIHHKYLDTESEHPHWEKMDVRDGLRRFSRAVV